MKCFTFVHGCLNEGIQVSTQGRQHIFLGQVESSSGERCKACSLEVSKDDPPIIKDNVIKDAFAGISHSSERYVITNTNQQSSSVMLRINTSCAEPEKKVKGKWHQIFGKFNIIEFGRGPNYIDSIIVLKSGYSTIITEEGGGRRFVVVNYKGCMSCSKVEQQIWFEDKRNVKNKYHNQNRIPETVNKVNDEFRPLKVPVII